jgi:ABC-2 type transport system ATP-binding protein
MTDNNHINVSRLSRHYADLTAVNDISFTVQPGEVLGFLGPNGAGKSTTMKMITGNLAPSSGAISICGIDLLENPQAAKAQIGYLPEQPPLYRDLKVDEFLYYCARLHGIDRQHCAKRIEVAKQRCGLTEVSKRLIGNLSKGFQQRIGIAQAILHRPSVIVLDEPTVGLDPNQIREIRALIKELGEQHAVILSTHILPEVQMTCDRVQIIHHGQLVFQENLSELNNHNDINGVIIALDHPPAELKVSDFSGVNDIEQLDNKRWKLQFSTDGTSGDDIARTILDKGWGLRELRPVQKNLEQIFIEITSSDGVVSA